MSETILSLPLRVYHGGTGCRVGFLEIKENQIYGKPERITLTDRMGRTILLPILPDERHGKIAIVARSDELANVEGFTQE